MFGSNQVMSSFSTNDIDACRTFYSETLGFDVEDQFDGLLLKYGGGGQTMVYPKDNHQPATFTVLHVVVDDVEKAVDDLAAKGVTFEHYDEEQFKTDAKGISRDMGGAIAWFKDPTGNIIGVIEMPPG